LNELKREMAMSLLFITHDLHIVRQLADNVSVMQSGKAVEHNSCQQLFSAPQHPYTRQVLDAEPSGEPLPVEDDGGPLLRVEHLHVSFPIKRGLLRRTVDEKQVVNNISFTLRRGESLGLVGESGSGKSTTGLALLRLIQSRGDIWFDGQPLQGLTRKQMLPFRHRIQVVFQDPNSALNPRLNEEQIIAEGLIVHHKLSKEAQEQRVVAVMQEV
ncbi:ATP-binding cassette domain-containing protein, partial [Dickeya dadantii]|nr:ATP-binding cassette domain-containing protein [Dickeya dadantii]